MAKEWFAKRLASAEKKLRQNGNVIAAETIATEQALSRIYNLHKPDGSIVQQLVLVKRGSRNSVAIYDLNLQHSE